MANVVILVKFAVHFFLDPLWLLFLEVLVLFVVNVLVENLHSLDSLDLIVSGHYANVVVNQSTLLLNMLEHCVNQGFALLFN